MTYDFLRHINILTYLLTYLLLLLEHLLVAMTQDTVEDEDEARSDVAPDDERMKAVKETNKLEERDAVMRGTQQRTDMTPLRVASHTVDVKNNVEKGPTSMIRDQ